MRSSMARVAIVVLAVVSAVADGQVRRPASAPSTSQSAATATLVAFDDVRPIVAAFLANQPDSLPVAFRSKSLDEIRQVWPAWIAGRDAEIRARLARGDEDTLVNFMLFGVTFTRQPRAAVRDVRRLGEGRTIADVVAARLDDLLTGMAAPGANERLRFARSVMERRGIDPSTKAGREAARELLIATVSRVVGETSGFARTVEAAKLLGDSSVEFARRSTLYQARGLSSDTSIYPDFAIEQSLEAMKAKGLLRQGSVRRVAIVGPGLDFTDKGEGYDFYPQQTIQPFAVLDSLFRLGLASPTDVRLTTFDLSPRINAHLASAAANARRGMPYTVQLLQDPEAGWTDGLRSYWERFGERIGSAVAPASSPSASSGLNVRAVRIRPAIVSLITPKDMNVVLQRSKDPSTDTFDLVIATNILVYYDVFEQCLALANIGQMLQPGGFLLSNNALLELVETPVHSVGYRTTVYSTRADDGDHIVWYQRLAASKPAT